jgi:ribosomal protein S27AE
MIGGSYQISITIILVVAVAIVALSYRIYLTRLPQSKRAKCPKCGMVFDSSQSYPILQLGQFKHLTCPSCGKTSFMNAHVKDPITYPKPQTETAPPMEKLEKLGIEESKYETS